MPLQDCPYFPSGPPNTSSAAGPVTFLLLESGGSFGLMGSPNTNPGLFFFWSLSLSLDALAAHSRRAL